MEEVDSEKPEAGLGRDLFMVALALLSIGMLVYDEVRHPAGEARQALILIDWAIVTVFAIEFVVGLVKSTDRKAYWKSHWWEIPGLVPMAAGEASFLRAFRLLRLVRLVRILRIISIVARLKRMNRVAGRFLGRSHLLTTITITATVLLGSAYAEYLFEREANPQHFGDFGDAIWWAVVTAATVGYGDKFPITLGGRIVATVLMFTGVGLIGVLAATFANALSKAPPAPASAPAERPLEERFSELARLREKGHLTEAEFAAAKARLLAEREANTSEAP